MMSRESFFLQIHTLTPYAATLLNRDDVGAAKRLPYGGTSRLRVSSQCLKRHWRDVASRWSLRTLADPTTGEEVAWTLRSRKIISREIGLPLVNEGFAPDTVVAVLTELKAKVLGESKKAKADKTTKADKKAKTDKVEHADVTELLEQELDTNQVIVLGRPEIEFMKTTARTLLQQAPNDFKAAVEAYFKRKEVIDNLRALRLAAGLDAALFGRMVTSDILARGDSAVHVAHALTVHAEEAELDYFTAIDDLKRDAGELGTGLIQTSELTSGLYYGYVVVDIPLLVSNLEGVAVETWREADLGLSSRVVEHLIHLIATTSAGAKLGSTAPYSYADFVLAEFGVGQPRSLMTAFHKALQAKEAREGAIGALARYLAGFEEMYGVDTTRQLASQLDTSALPIPRAEGGLAGLAAWAGAQVRGK
jgi:CRISPR system Cascade subunit CasC